jgi:transposase
MVKVDEYARIRRAHVVEKLSVRELARQFHHSRRKIREILGHAEPRPYTRTQTPPSVLDPFKSIIGDILRTDADAPRKQRHTAARVFRRLRDEHGYGGSAERVRLYIRSQRPRTSETFIPLDHDPGQRLEADFGHMSPSASNAATHGRFKTSQLPKVQARTSLHYFGDPSSAIMRVSRIVVFLVRSVGRFAFRDCPRAAGLLDWASRSDADGRFGGI